MKRVESCNCGEDDCRMCRAENFIRYRCEGCGEKVIRLALEKNENGLCPNCADLVQCDLCKGWYGEELVGEDRICTACRQEERAKRKEQRFGNELHGKKSH